jgi:AcrR family transcriptional regulator
LLIGQLEFRRIHESRIMPERTQGSDRLSEIYQKALDLFLTNGYDSTSTSMIAKASGVSQGNLFHYCHSKEILLYQIHLGDLQKRFIPILDEAEPLPDPKDRIVCFLQNFTLMCTSSPASRMLFHEIHSLDKNHQNENLSIWRRGHDLVRGAIEEFQMAGSLF